MRLIRGVDRLVDYLDEKNVPISRSTLYSLKREGRLPYVQVSPRVVVFDLNEIDKWLVRSSETKFRQYDELNRSNF